MRFSLPAMLFFSIFIGACSADKSSNRPLPPNIVFIFADDLGYGDLSCYGSRTIHTPVLDQMADSGVLFTDFYSASPVCSPSRAALLTGRYAARQGLYTVFFPESWNGIDTTALTMAQMLKTAGYATACVGKWHLGHHRPYLPLQNGFDEYFGIPYSNDMASLVYLRGNEVEETNPDPRYLTRRYTEEALDFIERKKNEPFFLYLAHNMPHVPLYVSPEYEGKSGNGLYADVIQELDASVGLILNKLKSANVLNNTIVVFTSDNGPWLAMRQMGGSAGPLREGKQFTFDGGMKVPCIVYAPGKLLPRKVNTLAGMMDWMPTFAQMAGVPASGLPDFDGKDISKLLTEGVEEEERELIYFNNGKAEAFRKGNYKIKMPYAGNPQSWWKTACAPHDTLLFDLSQDPGEKNDLRLIEKTVLAQMSSDFAASLAKLGELPPPLVSKYPADDSHVQYLKKEE